jgi:hypothetical protein
LIAQASLLDQAHILGSKTCICTPISGPNTICIGLVWIVHFRAVVVGSKDTVSVPIVVWTRGIGDGINRLTANPRVTRVIGTLISIITIKRCTILTEARFITGFSHGTHISIVTGNTNHWSVGTCGLTHTLVVSTGVIVITADPLTDTITTHACIPVGAGFSIITKGTAIGSVNATNGLVTGIVRTRISIVTI